MTSALHIVCIHGAASSACVDCAELRALRKVEACAIAVLDVTSLDAILELEIAIDEVKQVRSAAFEPELGTAPDLQHAPEAL
jgi:hypothetical protein